MVNCSFANNYAVDGGADIYLRSSSSNFLTVSNSSFRNGVVGGEGGSMLVSSREGGLTLVGVEISNATAGVQGGAISVRDDFTSYKTRIHLIDTVVDGARAGEFGGCFFLAIESAMVLDGGTVLQGCSAAHGGGIFVQPAAALEFRDGATIRASVAERGGGLHANVGANVTGNGVIEACNSTGPGGGMVIVPDDLNGLTSGVLDFGGLSLIGNIAGTIGCVLGRKGAGCAAKRFLICMESEGEGAIINAPASTPPFVLPICKVAALR